MKVRAEIKENRLTRINKVKIDPLKIWIKFHANEFENWDAMEKFLKILLIQEKLKNLNSPIITNWDIDLKIIFSQREF